MGVPVRDLIRSRSDQFNRSWAQSRLYEGAMVRGSCVEVHIHDERSVVRPALEEGLHVVLRRLGLHVA